MMGFLKWRDVSVDNINLSFYINYHEGVLITILFKLVALYE